MNLIETACYALALVSAASTCLALGALTLALNAARHERRAMLAQLARLDP